LSLCCFRHSKHTMPRSPSLIPSHSAEIIAVASLQAHTVTSVFVVQYGNIGIDHIQFLTHHSAPAGIETLGMRNPERYVGRHWVLQPGESVQYIRVFSTTYSNIFRHVQSLRPRQPHHRPLIIAAGVEFISSQGRSFVAGAARGSTITTQTTFDIRDWPAYPGRGITSICLAHGRFASIVVCTWGPYNTFRLWHLVDNTFEVVAWPRLQIEHSTFHEALVGA
jgi:hypothetical protein